MSLEKTILVIAWGISILSFILLIPHTKRREAWLAYLFKQTLTWPLGLLVVEYGLLEYPIGLFQNASKSSFTFEFMVYPVLCSFFNVYYPIEKSKLAKFGYYMAYTLALSFFELALAHYTNLIVYVHWNAFYTWFSEYLLFFISRRFYCWFFKIR